MRLSIFKVILRNSSLLAVLFLSSFCEKNIEYEIPVSVYSGVESVIRLKYDSYAIYKWDQYTELLTILSQDKFKVLPLNEMRNTYDKEKVVVGLRHDVDFNPFKALEMAKIEKVYRIRASYFFLATAKYYGKIVDSKMVRSPGIDLLFKEIHDTGAEIGIHNDLITIMVQYGLDPYLFNREELDYYRSLKIKIQGTAAHGSLLARQTKVPNYEIFSDFAKASSLPYLGKEYTLGNHSLKDFGFKYEAYSINYNIYLSESGGKWNDPEGLKGILKRLESSKPGDRIQILVHPDWWGKS